MRYILFNSFIVLMGIGYLYLVIRFWPVFVVLAAISLLFMLFSEKQKIGYTKGGEIK